MKKNTIFIIIVVVAAVLAACPIFPFSQDTTTAINNQLGEIDLNNLDGEFSDIDKDLQSL